MSLVVSLLCAVGAAAQGEGGRKCEGPIYSGNDVSRRAKVMQPPDAGMLVKIATGKNYSGTIQARGVLCRTGEVTDIEVITKLPSDLADLTVAAISTVRFTPAEMNLHGVSQRIGFEFLINDHAYVDEIDPAEAAGRLIEQVEILGSRTIETRQIISWMKTRAGEIYDAEQIKRDLKKILDSGYFDRRQSAVRTVSGVRGGVGVNFELIEAPFITEISFSGLSIDSSIVLRALTERLQIARGGRFHSELMNAAVALIKELLQAQGKQFSSVYTESEMLDAMKIKLRFIVRNDANG